METAVFRSVFWRSFFIQSCWSFEGRQNLGFLMALDPVLKKIYPDKKEYRAAAIRHLSCFNTQPYVSGCVLGVTAGMEVQRAQLPEGERKEFENKIVSMKTSLSTALAAVGDVFFWGSLRPAAAACTVLLWLVLWTLRAPHPIFLGALFYVAVFNAPALWVRWKGLLGGFRRRETLVEDLAALCWTKRARMIRRIGLAAAIIVLAASILVPPWGGSFGAEPAALFATAFALRRFGGVTPTRTYAGAVVLGALGAAALQ